MTTPSAIFTSMMPVARLEILNLLLAFLLGANHEEIHDGEDGYHHQDETHAAALCGLGC